MWNKLSMKEKAALIKVAVSNGLTDLDLIKNKYNEFANGGSITNKQALGGPLLNQNNPIESFNGGRRLPVVRYDEGGYAPSTTSIVYHPEDFYGLGDDVRFVGEKRIHNPKKSVETDAWYRENAPHYWTLMNTKDKSDFDLETKGLIKDIEKTIYNSGFESYIPEIVVTAKRPAPQTTQKNSTIFPTEIKNVEEILPLPKSIFTPEPSVKVKRTPGTDNYGNQRTSISDPYALNTHPEFMNLAENWANRVKLHHPNISEEVVRQAVDNLTLVDWGSSTGTIRNFVAGDYSPYDKKIQSMTSSSVQAHELEHALRDLVLGNSYSGTKEEINLIQQAYPSVDDVSEMFATNAELRESLTKDLGITRKQFNDYILDKKKITDYDIANTIYDSGNAYINNTDYVSYVHPKYHNLHLLYDGNNVNMQMLEDFIYNNPARMIEEYSSENSEFRKILNDINSKYEKTLDKETQKIRDSYSKVKPFSKKYYEMERQIRQKRTELLDKKSAILSEKLKGKEGQLLEELGNDIQKIGKKEYKQVYIKDQKKIDAVRKAMNEIAQNENNNNFNLLFT